MSENAATSEPETGTCANPTRRMGPDWFQHVENGPTAIPHRYLDAYLVVCLAAPPNHPGQHASSIRLGHMIQLTDEQSGIRLETTQAPVLHAALKRLAWGVNHRNAWHGDWWSEIAIPLLDLVAHLCDNFAAGTSSIASADIDATLRMFLSSHWLLGGWWSFAVDLAEQLVRDHGLTNERRHLIWDLANFIHFSGVAAAMGPEESSIPDRLDALTDRAPTGTIRAGESWADLILADLTALPDHARTPWHDFLRFTLTATTSTPAKIWLQRADAHLAALGRQAVEEKLLRWFESATKTYYYPPPHQNATILRGLIWCCALQPSERFVNVIGRLAEAMFKKIPGIGARSPKVGNACLYALSIIPGMASLEQLVRLRPQVKGQTTQASVEKALAAAAVRENLPRDAVEEMVVPTFGLDEHGLLREELGEHFAEITISGSQQITWRWRTPEGTSRASVPTPVKERHTAELKVLKRTVEDLRQTLAAQRRRLEGLFLLDRSWVLPVWRERYLDHPLIAEMCRRLIWQFEAGDQKALAIWYQDRLVDVTGRPLDWVDDITTVRLWHPLGVEPAVVLRWRLWLEECQIAQPFKQAHREVYLLTDAERATAFYSNRFAAHLLRQDTFYALCQERGWRYRVQGTFDSGEAGVARRTVPHADLCAEFWVQSEGGADVPRWGAGLYLTIPTDQIRFSGPDGLPRPLVEVPDAIFSETMREIDLFVSVCSVGNDPAWRDHGDHGPVDDQYWHHYAFGDLLTTAATRREVLTRLLPRLRIADRCRIAGRFLTVRGDLRTYKIHLGSGNILMEPNDQYLCIVPDPRGAMGPASQVFLPFEDDARLTLILSKAFILAADTTIKDPTIARQIRQL